MTSSAFRLEKAGEAQRTRLLQAHGVLTCLYEALLHAEGEEAVSYAQAAYVAASRSLPGLDGRFGDEVGASSAFC